MRVLHINCNYIGTTLHQLMIEKLDALGIENEVFVPTFDKNTAIIEVNNSVFVAECFKRRDRYFFDYKQSKILKTLEEHYDIKSFDLIHAYTLFTDGNAARILSKKYGVPYVVAVRNTDINTFFKKRLLLRNRGIQILKDSRKIFFLSNAYRKQCLEKYVSESLFDLINKKTEIVPNGIDDFWLQNKNKSKKAMDKDNIRLVYAGVIDKNKNITTTQKAMTILREKGIQTHLTVVGKIKDIKEYERIVKDKYTTYIPAQPKEKLIEIYRKNDIFVMPSIHESFGLVYAEAMSQGLPVIYTKGQGFDGQFEEGRVGYHVDSFCPTSIAEQLVVIINKICEIRDNVTEASNNFSWDIIAKKYSELYNNIWP